MDLGMRGARACSPGEAGHRLRGGRGARRRWRGRGASSNGTQAGWPRLASRMEVPGCHSRHPGGVPTYMTRPLLAERTDGNRRRARRLITWWPNAGAPGGPGNLTSAETADSTQTFALNERARADNHPGGLTGPAGRGRGAVVINLLDTWRRRRRGRYAVAKDAEINLRRRPPGRNWPQDRIRVNAGQTRLDHCSGRRLAASSGPNRMGLQAVWPPVPATASRLAAGGRDVGDVCCPSGRRGLSAAEHSRGRRPVATPSARRFECNELAHPDGAADG